MARPECESTPGVRILNLRNPGNFLMATSWVVVRTATPTFHIGMLAAASLAVISCWRLRLPPWLRSHHLKNAQEWVWQPLILMCLVPFTHRWALVSRRLWQRRQSATPPLTSVEATAYERKRRFRRWAGSRYGYTGSAAGHVDTWRAAELPGLIRPLGTVSSNSPGERGMVYLDYAGAALPVRSQLESLAAELSAATVLANPHSTGPAAAAAAEVVERMRHKVLSHFCGERADEWVLIWTSGATAALRLVAESFPFCEGSTFLYSQNSHTCGSWNQPTRGQSAEANCHSTCPARRTVPARPATASAA